MKEYYLIQYNLIQDNVDYFLVQHNEIPEKFRMFLVPVEDVDDTVLEMLEFMDGQIIEGTEPNPEQEQKNQYATLLDDLFCPDDKYCSGEFPKYNCKFANKKKIAQTNFFVKKAFSLNWII
jgi:hypothetical protein